MLKEHLNQNHGAASRPTALIDKQVAWLHQQVFDHQPKRILDLGCGPGLYTRRLADLGHVCHGIDFSPASTRHAASESSHARASYQLADIREGDYGEQYTAALILFGEFNAFSANEAERILQAAYQSLSPGGTLILEAHTLEYLQTLGNRPPNWFSATSSVFSDRAHICLHECSWHEDVRSSVDSYFVIEDGEDEISEYTNTHQAYRDDEYDALLISAGFRNLRRFPALSGCGSTDETGLFVLIGEK
jgi:SAM-dependent methyltransferase